MTSPALIVQAPPRPALAVVMLTWNGKQDTIACLRSLRPQLRPEDQVIVVDNGSTDGTEDSIRARFPNVHFIQNGSNLGFAGGNNPGLEAALELGTPWVLVLNNDTLCDLGTIDALLCEAEAARAEDPRVAVLQPVLVRADSRDSIDSCGQVLSRSPGAADLAAGQPVAGLPDHRIPLFGACGAAILIHRDALCDVRGFDERLFVLFEDTDLAFRLRAAGHHCVLAPSVRIRHKRGVSGKRDESTAAQQRSFWVQRNIVTLALRWWPLWMLLTSPVLLWRMWTALRLAHQHGFGPCASLWKQALAERRPCRTQLRRHGGDAWFLAGRSIEALARPEQGRTHRRIVGGSLGVLALRGTSSLFGLATSVLLARLLGISGFGAYQGVMAWLAFLAVPAGLGAEKLVLQRVALHKSEQDWSRLHGLLRCVFLGVVSAAILSGLAALAFDHFTASAPTGFAAGLLVLPTLVLLRIVVAAMQGMERVVRSQLPDLIIAPGVLLLALGSAWLLGIELSPATALLCLLVANATALLVALRFLFRALPQQVRQALPRYEIREWWTFVLPLLLMAGLQVLNARSDIVLLGWIAGDSAVGSYSAAVRCAGVISSILMVTNAFVAPVIARSLKPGDHPDLQQIVTRTTRFAALIATPILLVYLLLGDTVLSVFGADFVDAQAALAITSIGHFSNVIMGPVAIALVMAGMTRRVSVALAFGVVVNLALDLLLIPQYGGTGAAIASAASALTWNGLLVVQCAKRISLHTTIFGRPTWLRS